MKGILYFGLGAIIGVVLLFSLVFLSRCVSAYSGDKKTSQTPFVRAIIASESTFNPKAISRVGARGLMQLMPSTANMVHRSLFGTNIPIHRLYDPYVNVALGTTYLLELIYEFKDIDKALAAYNGGPGAVKRGYKAKEYVHKIHRYSRP